jgi:anthranilate synthase / indole-3-glycerol phosphate synthase / phosphoribosylanthranilate isomerase
MVTRILVPEVNEILDAKRAQLVERKRKTPIEAIRALASMQKRPAPLLNTVTANEPVMLIGQIRHQPPTDESFGGGYDPVSEAVRYARDGVDTIALFTDATIYRGGLDDLMFVARAVQSFNIPVITQDYIFDEYQIVEARAAGAAGLVLTASVIDCPTLRTLVSSTQRNRMTAIVRVANEEELGNTVNLSPQVIALSAEHPVTGQVDHDLLRRLRSLIPSHIRVMVVGDMHSLNDIEEAVRLRVNAVVVGAPLLKSAHLPQIRAMLSARLP